MNLGTKMNPANPVGSICELNDQLIEFGISSNPTPVHFTGGRSLGGGVEGAFKVSEYPVKGYSTVHLIYSSGTHGGSQAERGRWY